MDINSIDLLALQTRQMQADPTTQGLCGALSDEFTRVAEAIPYCYGPLMLKLCPELATDEFLSQLAYDMRVDWYFDSQSREAKIQAILNSRAVYQQQGTPAAVERAVQPYFDAAFVREWFEYGGDPLHYKVYVQGELTQAEAALLFRAIRKSARRSAMLDGVVTILLSTAQQYAGIAMVRRRKITITGG